MPLSRAFSPRAFSSRAIFRLLAIGIVGYAAVGASAQKVDIPAHNGEAAKTVYVFWSCGGRKSLLGGKADAPDVTVAPAEPLVSGRFYKHCTGKEQFAEYFRDTYGYRSFLSAGVRAGIEQYNTVPTGWGQDTAGYFQRYGSAFGETAIERTVRYSLAAALHEDVRYLICHKCSFGEKLQNAVFSEFTARHGTDGHRVFSVTPIIGSVSGPLIAYSAWYPPGYGPDRAIKHVGLGVGTRIGFRLLQELVFDRDSKPEKEAKKAAREAASAGLSK